MTTNRALNETEMEAARTLLADIRARIDEAAGDDEQLRFALNRKDRKSVV